MSRLEAILNKRGIGTSQHTGGAKLLKEIQNWHEVEVAKAKIEAKVEQIETMRTGFLKKLESNPKAEMTVSNWVIALGMVIDELQIELAEVESNE